jgi:hypothetical protein
MRILELRSQGFEFLLLPTNQKLWNEYVKVLTEQDRLTRQDAIVKPKSTSIIGDYIEPLPGCSRPKA